MFFDNLAIPADAPHVKNAHLFIDFLMQPEVAAANSNYISYANGNAASLPLIDADVREQSGHLSAAGDDGQAVPGPCADAEFTRELTRTWTRFKTGK